MSERRVKRSRRWLVLLAALFLAGCAVFAPGQASRAFARTLHAVLVHTDPPEGSVLTAPPRVIRLWFSEAVQLVEPAVTIYGPSGGIVAQGHVEELNGVVSVPFNASADGTYLVTWQVISQDTDPASGSFIFSLRHAGGPWTGSVSSSVAPLGLWLQVLGHLLHFLGYTLGFGPLIFLALVVYPLKRANQEALREPIRRLVTAGILILVLAEAVALLAQSASLGTHALFDAVFLSTVLGSSFGRALALRLGAALVLWVLVGIARQGNRKAVLVALILGGALAVIDSLASHAITAPVAWLIVLVTALHIMAMGAWPGGVLTLLLLWRLKAAQNYRQELLARFSPLALAFVGELALTGVVLSALHLSSLTDLVATIYGRVLLGKMLFLFLPLLFALFGRGQHTSRRERWWLLELLALVGILVLAGVLAALPPVR
ncbi:MAG TPA: copper resistance protein CopC [Ktedonobacteraceae bacterium]